MGVGLEKCTLGTLMSSNYLVTHQAHKNGQYYDLKQSKIAKETQE